jgi:L,D-transpeptidase YcbB
MEYGGYIPWALPGVIGPRFTLSFARPLLVSLTLVLASASGALPAFAETPAEVQKRLEGEGSAIRIGERTVELAPLRTFYRERGYKLAWTDANEVLGETLLAEMQSVALAEGLAAEAYAVPAAASDLDHDLLISDTLLRFARDLSGGRVAPQRAYGGMGPDSRTGFDGAKVLREVAAGKPFAEAAGQMPPPYAGYVRLRQALDRTRAVARAGGWPTIPDGPSLKPGMEDTRVAVLRKRLVATGELAPQYVKGYGFDGHVVEALKRFQARHGLDQDGAVGKRTLAALNVSPEGRINQILANLERWRWLPRRLASHHIAVNVPAATLELVEDGRVTMAMRVVVGDSKHPTPTMSASMSTLVLNPPWVVPPSIATKEILPKLRRDPNYLVSNNLRITAFPEDSPEAAGTGTDWNQVAGKFPYRLRQQPGPDNALGQLKFNLVDSDDIYLHDTPNHNVFTRAYRALSHGCVRVEMPIALGERLLGEEWQGRLVGAIATSGTRTLKLERTMPVYLLYWTAWADDDGTVHFRDDLYGHDLRLIAALKRARSGAAQMAQGQPQGAL